eukprot:2203992-Heterocapsa_arctica.AAC.1
MSDFHLQPCCSSIKGCHRFYIESNIDIDIENLSVRGYRAIGETSRYHHQIPDESLIIFRKV